MLPAFQRRKRSWIDDYGIKKSSGYLPFGGERKGRMFVCSGADACGCIRMFCVCESSLCGKRRSQASKEGKLKEGEQRNKRRSKIVCEKGKIVDKRQGARGRKGNS
jgi:hypothetical protein